MARRTFQVLEQGAEELYEGRGLKRFSEKDMAFKKVSEDLRQPWFEVWMKNMLGQYKKAQIGDKVYVKDVKEARSHIALWVGASTWNRLTMPYGEG
ncbi:MAG: hypothetical protein JRJ48_07060, partial [Deltaproteobacteria bacterium]|nr:hypothetical protein [Deltaproteobacteria bacterium]